MSDLSSNERCINWPCAMRKGHVGPCSTSPEQRSSKQGRYYNSGYCATACGYIVRERGVESWPATFACSEHADRFVAMMNGDAVPPSAGRALDREDLIIPATRYYMGRRTIGVTAHCYALARAWPDLSRNVQDIIRRDLEEEFRRDDAMRADEKCSRSYYPLGDDCDREAWEMVRAAWGAVTKETGYTWTPDAQGAVNGPPRERDCASDETKGGQS